jgi:hypothetical protein
MAVLSWIKKSLALLVVVSLLVWIFIFNWSFVFKKKIIGEVVAVEKVSGVMTVITNSTDPVNPQAFSFSVALKDLKTSEIHMASSEDRKWAAVQKGNCAVAAFFPYPPWNLQKGSTDHNARLLKNYENCALATQEESLWDKISFFFLWM